VDVEVHKNSILGSLIIQTFSKNSTFWPQRVKNEDFEKMANGFKANQNSMIRFQLSDKICEMLAEISPLFNKSKQGVTAEEFSLQDKQITITRLVRQTGINVSLLKLNKDGSVKLDFHKMRDNLNQILLAQYVMKSGLNLTKADLREIQLSDLAYSKIITNMELSNREEIGTFVLYEQILYKTKVIMNQTVFRLCLPNFLARDVLQKLHFKHDVHLTADNLLNMFNQTFYAAESGKIVNSILKQCILCRLNKNKRQKNTSG
jgi:hypothetical protein